MPQTLAAAFAEEGERSPPEGPAAREGDWTVSVCDDLRAVEAEWRALQAYADGTPFQSFDWLAAWQRHVGARCAMTPAIVIGRDGGGKTLFLLPLAVGGGMIRRLTWLGSDLCDYNAPLLAPEFGRTLADRFPQVWHEIRRQLQAHAHLRHDVVELRKMPQRVGTQDNPFLALGAALHPSGAHLAHLSKDWEGFYRARRSSATRRSDRTKLQRLTARHGEIRFVSARDGQDAARTLETLMTQKAAAFARMGVPNLFARPGHREFFLDLALNPPADPGIHISRLEVGPSWAACNFGLTYRGTYYHVLASYDQGEVSRYGPGSAHLRELMRYAIERGLDRFDFTIGDEPYKLEWSDTVIRLYDHIAPATVQGVPAAFWIDAMRGLKRAVKQNPRLFALAGRARALLRAGMPRRRRR